MFERKITPIKEKNIMKQILEGHPYAKIAKKYKVCTSTIQRTAAQNHLRRQIPKSQKKWTLQNIDKFLLDNNSTIRRNSIEVINTRIPIEFKCLLCGDNWKQSFDSLKRKKNLQGCSNCGNNPHTLYHDILNTIDPYSAYFLGTVTAKGCIKGKTISFSSPNKAKLTKLAKTMSATYPITIDPHNKYITSNLKPVFKLTIQSPKIIQKLKELKVDKSSIPKCIPKIYMHDFIRGYFDFTGYVEILTHANKIKPPKESMRVNICGNQILVNQIQSQFKKCANKKTAWGKGYLTQKSREGLGNRAELHYNGARSANAFLSWLYNTSPNTLKYVDDEKYKAYIHSEHLIEKE